MIYPRTVDGLDTAKLDNLEATNATITNVTIEDVATDDISAVTLAVSGASTLNTVSANSVAGGVMTGTSLAATGAISGAAISGSSLSVTGAVTAASVAGGVMTGTSLAVTGAISGAAINGSSLNVTGAVTAASVSGGVMTGTSLSVPTLTCTGTTTLSTPIILSSGTVIRANTADGADINAVSLCGGGDIGSARGARIICRGNEHPTLPGKLQLIAGDTGRIEFSANNDTVRGSVEQNGSFNIFGTTATTSSTTGILLLNGGIGINNATDAVSVTNGGTLTSPGGGAFAKSFWVGTTLNVAGAATVGSVSSAGAISGTALSGTTLNLSGTLTGVSINASGTVTASILNATNYVQIKSATLTSNTNDLLLNGNSATVSLRPLGTGAFALHANPSNLQITDTAGVARTTITNGGDISCLSVTTSAAATVGTLLTAATVQVTGTFNLQSTSMTSTGNNININANNANIALRPVNTANYNLIVTPTNVQVTNSSGVTKTTISNGGDIACDTVTTTGLITGSQFVGGVSGSWTPTIQSDTTVTYTTRVGTYYKLGNIVVMFATVATTGAMNITANADMALLGLPFVNTASIIQLGTCMLNNYDLPVSTDFVTPFVANGANWFNFGGTRDNLGIPFLKTPTTSATRTMYVQITMYT